MSSQTFTTAFHVPGTLGADADIRFAVEEDCTLVRACAVSSNSRAAGLQIGTPSDTDAYLVKSDVGVSLAPVEFTFTDFATYDTNRAYPRLSAGDVLVVSIDYDYAGGAGPAPSANITVILTFTDL